MPDLLKSLGICLGASTIKIAEVDSGGRVLSKSVINHECNPRKVLGQTLATIDLGSYSGAAVTGRKFKDMISLPAITEPEATEYALKGFFRTTHGPFNALISLGSENFILYELDEAGSIIRVQTGNKCASGTGEFFLQQIRRMNVGLEEALALASGSDPYYVSGRCSVFCKSDCTHALNKGIPAGRVCAGLGNMIAEKVLELLKSVERRNILIVGGVTRNTYVVDRLRREIDNLVIPPDAEAFEAVGAAVFALENRAKHNGHVTIKEKLSSFSTLTALSRAKHLVTFFEHGRAVASEGDECILGLDVGSTTTKAVLLRTRDDRIVASVYLRTNGNPIQASRECYREIDQELGGTAVRITALGVTGSGRHIAGLHALTDGIVNEIIAHATGATFFSRDVDTIIEIGGQDAKYTYLVNGVPCDYAMNEACSAGTGSFLEEAASESLGISYLGIQDIALRGDTPPNFNDQCAAFISSDIKNASHEDISRENIIAGLVYSICMNYNNRVKGSRKVGAKVFMQGGVCYNKAVPLAMATLLNREIIVPPDPGLIGAFGVALEIKNRIASGILKPSAFSLKELAGREVGYGESIICPGTQEQCDRGCTINIIRIDGRNYPFGGICNKYYNTVHHLAIDPKPFDSVAKRQELLSRTDGALEKPSKKTIGIPKSFHTNTLFPLYHTFFTELGFEVVLGDRADPEGMKMTASSFCFPVEIAHGMFMDLLKKRPDFIFLPHIPELFVEGSGEVSKEHQCACVLSQSEPYYIRSAFRDIQPEMLSPVINFYRGWDSVEKDFIGIGRSLGAGNDESSRAFSRAIAAQKEFNRAKKELGDAFLAELKRDPSAIGIVIFGRAYNAFAAEANLGIPRKFASRGVRVIPFDCLRYEDEDSIENMNWAIGQEMMKASRVIKRHPQLFGAYITNFSCGPDSFLVGYFRDIMKTKPSLTLELDSHTADAGVNTRIDAFLDIIQRYRRIGSRENGNGSFRPAELRWTNGTFSYVSSDGREYSVKDRRVTMLVPSMGAISSDLVAAAFRGVGFNAAADKPPDFQTLMLGRANTSCKECLPLILTTASLLESAGRRKSPDDLLLYFMPTATGSCRFSQYYVFQKQLIEKKKIPNVALLTLTTENSYAGMGTVDQIKVLKAIVTADVLDDIRNALRVLAVDKKRAGDIFEEQVLKVRGCFERGCDELYDILKEVASELSSIRLRYPISEARKVLIAGEIYVRKDEFCSRDLIERLARRDIIARRSPLLEWLYYVDYVVRNQLKPDYTLRERTELLIRRLLHHTWERKIKRALSSSGLYEPEMIDIETIMKVGSNFINPAVTGEAIVVVGAFFSELVKHIHGMVSLGPFACMPLRVTESILSRESRIAGNDRLDSLGNIDELRKYHTLPFLSVESDGNPFPQIVEARIEAFALQVERLHDKMKCGPLTVK